MCFLVVDITSVAAVLIRCVHISVTSVLCVDIFRVPTGLRKFGIFKFQILELGKSLTVVPRSLKIP